MVQSENVPCRTVHSLSSVWASVLCGEQDRAVKGRHRLHFNVMWVEGAGRAWGSRQSHWRSLPTEKGMQNQS